MYDFDKVNNEINQLQKEIRRQSNMLEAQAKILLFTLQKQNENGGNKNAINS